MVMMFCLACGRECNIKLERGGRGGGEVIVAKVHCRRDDAGGLRMCVIACDVDGGTAWSMCGISARLPPPRIAAGQWPGWWAIRALGLWPIRGGDQSAGWRLTRASRALIQNELWK